MQIKSHTLWITAAMVLAISSTVSAQNLTITNARILDGTGRVIDRYLPPGSATGTNPPRYTIDFTAADRRVVRFITDSVGWKPKQVGDTVDVLYNPADPEDACVRGGEPVAAWLFTTAGVIFTIIGLFMTLSAVGLVMDRSAR